MASSPPLAPLDPPQLGWLLLTQAPSNHSLQSLPFACSPAGVWGCGPGADDHGGLRLSLQVHHATAEQRRVQPGAQWARARRGLLHGGDAELRQRLPLLLHGAALVTQPLRKRVEDGEAQEAGARAPQGMAGWRRACGKGVSATQRMLQAVHLPEIPPSSESAPEARRYPSREPKTIWSYDGGRIFCLDYLRTAYLLWIPSDVCVSI